MAKLIRRGRNWYSDLRIGGRRIRRALSSDKQIAEEKLSDLIKERGAARHGHAVQDVSWQTFKTKYLEHSRTEKAAKTYHHDLRALENLEAIYPVRSLAQITPEVLDDVKRRWTDAGRGLYVRNREIRAIKTAMRKAEAWRYVAPANWRSVKEGKEPKGRLRFYTAPELRRLVKHCAARPISPLWLTVCLLGARAGLRREEMRWLEWSDIDFANNRVHVAPKAGWNPKDYERRWIPMFSDLRRHLAQIKRRAKSAWILAQEGDRPTAGSMTEYFGRLVHQAGLGGNLHTLRHTFGAHLVQAGVSLRKIQKWMGHSSIETTEIYAHLAPVDATEQDIERLPRL